MTVASVMSLPKVIADMASGGTCSYTRTGAIVQALLYTFSDGTIAPSSAYPGTNTSSGLPTQWAVNPATGVGNTWYVRCVVNSGSITDGDLPGTWLTLGTAPKFGLERNSVGTTTANVTIQFSDDSVGSTVRGSFTCTISATFS